MITKTEKRIIIVKTDGTSSAGFSVIEETINNSDSTESVIVNSISCIFDSTLLIVAVSGVGGLSMIDNLERKGLVSYYQGKYYITSISEFIKSVNRTKDLIANIINVSNEYKLSY